MIEDTVDGHYWLLTVKDLRLLASLAPVAPQHRWMLRNSSWESIIHRQMLPGTTTDDIFLCDSYTEVEVTCQLALFHSRRVEEQIEHLLSTARKESESATSTQSATPDTRRSSSEESNMSSDDSMVVPERKKNVDN